MQTVKKISILRLATRLAMQEKTAFAEFFGDRAYDRLLGLHVPGSFGMLAPAPLPNQLHGRRHETHLPYPASTRSCDTLNSPR